MSEMINQEIMQAVSNFLIEGELLSFEKYGNGHINDTYLIVMKDQKRTIKYILQRINHVVFKDPEKLMENISGVTAFIRKSIEKAAGDSSREVLTVINTKTGAPLYKDGIGHFWRMYLFIVDSKCLEKVSRPEDFYQSAVAFGRFQKQLADFDAFSLHETIKDFHNTPARFIKFCQAVHSDPYNRAAKVAQEIAFFMEREDDMKVCLAAFEDGRIPFRVTHNDTKLNNVMLDNKTGVGLCVIDLDTVMPGLAVFDFGDSIRFGANTAAEDECDLKKVHLDMVLFETYVDGFLHGCDGSLTKEETALLSYGAKTMTLECGIRFMTDYLEGDTYFKIYRENHNLDRCRTQIALVQDMEAKWSEMEKIVKRYTK